MKRFISFMLAAVMLLLLVACGDKSNDGDTTAKDTLVIGHYGDTPNFDTHNNLNDNGMRINMSVYDPLVRMDNETYEIKPCLAKSWTISEDGKEYTLRSSLASSSLTVRT